MTDADGILGKPVEAQRAGRLDTAAGVFDIVYNPASTRLLALAAEAA